MDNATPTPDVPQMPATTEEIMATLQSSYEALCAVKTNVRAALLAAGAGADARGLNTLGLVANRFDDRVEDVLCYLGQAVFLSVKQFGPEAREAIATENISQFPKKG